MWIAGVVAAATIAEGDGDCYRRSGLCLMGDGVNRGRREREGFLDLGLVSGKDEGVVEERVMVAGGRKER